MKILGIDSATKTGWAICDGGEITASGVKDFTKKRGESNGILYLKFRKWLREMILEHDIDAVCYEQAHHRGGAATALCVNLAGRIEEVSEDLNKHYESVHSATLKKFATGHGKATKEAMIAAINARRFEAGASSLITDDNEADACWLALYLDVII